MEAVNIDLRDPAQEDTAPKTPPSRIIVRDVPVSSAIFTENPAQLLIHPPELPQLRN